MPCPDDDTYARFIQGLLPEAERREVDVHLDGCALCGELIAELGRAYAEVAATRRSAAPPALPKDDAAPIDDAHDAATLDDAARENAAHENAAHENAAHENAAHENAAHENAAHENAARDGSGASQAVRSEALPPAEDPQHALGSREIVRLHGFALGVHLLLTAKLVATGSDARVWDALLPEPWSTFLPWYALLLGPIGAAAAAVSVWGALRFRSWGSRAARAHALLTLPHVALAPLAVYVLTRYRA